MTTCTLKRKGNIRKKKKIDFHAVFPYLCILPLFTLIIIFTVKPFIFACIKCFYNYDGISVNKFVGFDNFKKLIFDDVMVRIGIKNLFVFFIGLIIAFPFSPIVAEVLFNIKNRRLQKTYSRLIIIPIVVPAVAIYMLWKFIYYPEVGVIAQLGKTFGFEYSGFLGGEKTVKPALIMMGIPFVNSLTFLMSYSQLQAIDEAVFEAAKIDGCPTLKRVFAVDLPELRPMLKAMFIMNLMGFMQDYQREFIITGGGPNNASMTPGLHMYNLAFGIEPEYGYSCALAILIFIVSATVGTTLLRLWKEED